MSMNPANSSCRGQASYHANDVRTSSIVGVQTRPQCSPDLEAKPTSGYYLTSSVWHLYWEVDFFSKDTTPLKYSIKSQKLKNHRSQNITFFWQTHLEIATRQKTTTFYLPAPSPLMPLLLDQPPWNLYFLLTTFANFEGLYTGGHILLRD